MAILDDGSAYGAGLAREAEKALAATGVKPALGDSYTQRQRDFSTLIVRLKETKIAVAYIGAYHNDIGLLVRRLRGALNQPATAQ